MYTQFYREDDSRSTYFNLSNSLNINCISLASKTLKYSGLYAIYNGDVCVYVGQSQNISSRITQHIFGRYSSATKIYIFLASFDNGMDFNSLSKTDRKTIIEYNEWLLIKKLKPTENLRISKQDSFTDDLPKMSLFHDDDVLDYVDMSVFIGDIVISTCSGTSIDPTITTQATIVLQRGALEVARAHGFEVADKLIEGDVQ